MVVINEIRKCNFASVNSLTENCSQSQLINPQKIKKKGEVGHAGSS